MSFCSVHDKHNPPGTVCPHCRFERRERIATAVLAGFANSKPAFGAEFITEGCIKTAVEWADALIAELDKEQK